MGLEKERRFFLACPACRGRCTLGYAAGVRSDEGGERQRHLCRDRPFLPTNEGGAPQNGLGRGGPQPPTYSRRCAEQWLGRSSLPSEGRPCFAGLAGLCEKRTTRLELATLSLGSLTSAAWLGGNAASSTNRHRWKPLETAG